MKKHYMKSVQKFLSLAMTIALLLTATACSSGTAAPAADTPDAASSAQADTTAAAETTAAPSDPFPFEGTWRNDDGKVFWQIKADGTMDVISVMTSTSTHTVNGVTTTSSSTSTFTNSATWTSDDDHLYYNGSSEFNLGVNGDTYTIYNANITYTRVGDLNYNVEADMAGSAAPEAAAPDLSSALAYILGTTIVADGFEITFTEGGIASDIRYTSKSSGITITAGPSVIDGKEYVYLRGTLKNTSHTSIRPAIAGKVVLDGYEYNLSNDLIKETGSPTFSADPLETMVILVYADISTELTGSFSDGTLYFGFNDNFANVQLESAQYLYSWDVTK